VGRDRAGYWEMEIGENDAHTNELNVHFENWIQNNAFRF
jgi:hypothetical protein